jgi:uroporphyrinogen-III decarboxylase
MDKTLTSKRLVRGAFESADLPRLPFVPWVFTHAARLEQIPVRRMFADPTQYTKCLQNARKLYGYDAVIGGFDPSLELEICGYRVSWRGDYEAPVTSPGPEFDFGRLQGINVENAARTGRFGTVIESLRRIKMVSGQDLALAAVVTGPLSFLAGLTGSDPLKDMAEKPEETIKTIEAAAGFLLKVIQVYCQMELDIIVIADKLMAALPAAHISRLQSVLSPVVNMVRFYNTFSVLLPGEATPGSISGLIDLGFDGIIAAGIDVATWHELKGGRSCVLGKAIPARVLNSGSGELQTYLEANLPGKVETDVFITTDWEVPPEIPPDNIHLAVRMISGH